MFWLSILFLVVLAGLFHRHQYSDTHLIEFQLQVAGLAVLWLVFLVEGVWRLCNRDHRVPRWKDFTFFILVLIFPPLRIGARSFSEDRAVWFPLLGWQPVDRELRRALERFFSVPMIVIALMVLPLLAIHFGWSEQVEESPGLALFLAIGNGIIWFAFAAEFTIMISVAKKRTLYCTQHWVDVAIILLPLLQFFPFLPLLRLLRIGGVLRLEQLSRMGRVYRLQGLALKLWRAILLLDVIQRFTGQSLEKRAKRLKELMSAKEEEMRELRLEIEEIEKRIAQQKEAAVQAAESSASVPNVGDRPEAVRRSAP